MKDKIKEQAHQEQVSAETYLCQEILGLNR